VVIALLLSVPLRRPDWEVLPESFKEVFSLSLVLSATMMRVETLPAASWAYLVGTGVRLRRIRQYPAHGPRAEAGRVRLGYLAYAVASAGRYLVGSSGGVALSNMFGIEVGGALLYHGWHVSLAYVLRLLCLADRHGLHPNPPHKAGVVRTIRQPAIAPGRLIRNAGMS